MEPETPVTPATAHWPTLVFEDGDGDLCRCDCGEQGFDFQQGREWFAQHLAAILDAAPEAAERAGGLDRPAVERLRQCFIERGDCEHGVWEAVTGDHFREHVAAALGTRP